MVALNFKAEFADDVANGRKPCTIRVKDQGIKPGTSLQLYTGMRGRRGKATLLRETVCKSINTLEMRDDGHFFRVILNGQTLTSEGLRRLACEDGFKTRAGFADFFNKQYGLPFDGFLIRWI